MKKLFIFLLISTFLFAGLIIAGDKLPTTQSGRPYYDIYDEDDMATDSNTGIPTQQSVKAYVDSGTATLSGKTLTSPVINTGVSGTAVLDEDDMTTDSATQIATQQSIKAYVDDSVAPNTKFINVTLEDISSSGSAYLVAPVTGTITRMCGVLGSEITGVSGAVNLSAYGSAMGTLTVATSSTAGTVDYVVPSAISVAKGQAITIQSYGSSTGTATEWVSLEMTPATTVLSKYVVGEIADISTGASSWVTAPVAGTIENIWTVIDGAIITVDAGISFELGGTAVTGGAITIDHATSAAAVVDTSAPTALNTVTQGQAIEIITDGASTNSVKAVVIFEILPS